MIILERKTDISVIVKNAMENKSDHFFVTPDGKLCIPGWKIHIFHLLKKGDKLEKTFSKWNPLIGFKEGVHPLGYKITKFLYR